MDKEIHYELMDDGGSNAMYLPIILPVGGFLHHEYGTYKVTEHVQKGYKGASNFMILCERTSTNVHPELK